MNDDSDPTASAAAAVLRQLQAADDPRFAIEPPGGLRRRRLLPGEYEARRLKRGR